MSDAIIGFAGVLIGVIATIGKDAVSHWIGKRNSGRYAAVRIVCILDQYVEKCVEVVADDGTAEGRPAGRTESGEEYYCAQVDSPEPPTFPDDVEWTSISPELMYRILALPNLALGTERFVKAESEHSFPPDHSEFFQARWEGYADLGLEALEIIAALRRKFGLPKPSIAMGNLDWDAARFLRQKKDEVQRLREAERTANSAFLAEMIEKTESQ
ncbi:hypothetical protein [Erythrobacter sp. WG]|uniref:hypothetical protein n=1 Tax=Erythrobacter sp. WG TaxID=2985510 RepID=UPI00226F78EA|nr:hypothetical protein [Erythrobacter sp. WG]MCX9145913.1 hypothetical protein [Erythrobacter sp. WG]